jgi:hypothetical protein
MKYMRMSEYNRIIKNNPQLMMFIEKPRLTFHDILGLLSFLFSIVCGAIGIAVNKDVEGIGLVLLGIVGIALWIHDEY